MFHCCAVTHCREAAFTNSRARGGGLVGSRGAGEAKVSSCAAAAVGLVAASAAAVAAWGDTRMDMVARCPLAASSNSSRSRPTSGGRWGRLRSHVGLPQ